MEKVLKSSVVCPEFGKDYPRIARAEGIYVYDEDGKEYIDGTGAAAAVVSIGHGRVEVAQCYRDQVNDVAVIPTHLFYSSTIEEYYDTLLNFIPGNYTKAWTVTSGTEAVENAIKLALQYQKLSGNDTRYKILSRWGSYHGNSIFCLDVSGMPRRRNTYQFLLNNFSHIEPVYPYRDQQNGESDIEYALRAAGRLEEAILREGPETVAAFVAEPVVGNALGAVCAPDGYFAEIRRICDKYGVLFIADEVISGIGRTGKPNALAHWGVEADIIAFGKGISGGYFPLSAIVARENVAKVLGTHEAAFWGGHTFACNPLGAAIGKCVLDIIEKENLVEKAAESGDWLLKKMEKLKEIPWVGDVRGKGMLFAVEYVKDRVLKTTFDPEFQLSKKIVDAALEEGLVLFPGTGSVDGYRGNHIWFAPPLNCTTEELAMIFERLEAAHLAVEEQYAPIENESLLHA